MTLSNLRFENLTATSAIVRWDWTGANPALFATSLFDGDDFFQFYNLAGSARSQTFTMLRTGVEYRFTIQPLGGSFHQIRFVAEEPVSHFVGDRPYRDGYVGARPVVAGYVGAVEVL